MHFCSPVSHMSNVYIFTALLWNICIFPSTVRGKKIILSCYEYLLDHLSTEETKDLGKHSSSTQKYRIPRFSKSVNRRKNPKKHKHFKCLGQSFPKHDPTKLSQTGYILPNCSAAVFQSYPLCDTTLHGRYLVLP